MGRTAEAADTLKVYVKFMLARKNMQKNTFIFLHIASKFMIQLSSACTMKSCKNMIIISSPLSVCPSSHMQQFENC